MSEKQLQFTPLQQAYLGEIYGVAFFDYFIKNRVFSQNERLYFLQLLRIEKITLNKLKLFLLKQKQMSSLPPLLIDHILTQKTAGTTKAKQLIDLPWKQLIVSLLNWVKPYKVKYENDVLNFKKALESNEIPFIYAHAEQERFKMFSFVSFHETAIYQSLLVLSLNNNDFALANEFLDIFNKR